MTIELISFQNIQDNKVFIDLALARNDLTMKKYLRSWQDTSITNQLNWRDSIVTSLDCMYYIIQSNNNIIGYCGLDKIHPVNRTAEISIMIMPVYQNSGYGKETIRELLKIAFNQFNINCVFAESYLYSERKEFINKFWIGCGFKPEGILRARKYWDGKYWNAGLYSILKIDYMLANNEQFAEIKNIIDVAKEM